jgi:hypothetical protein
MDRNEQIQKMLPSPRRFRALVQKAINEEPLSGSRNGTESVADFDSYCDYRIGIVVGVAYEIFYERVEQAGLSWFINDLKHLYPDCAVEEIEYAIQNNDTLWGILCDAICDEL